MGDDIRDRFRMPGGDRRDFLGGAPPRPQSPAPKPANPKPVRPQARPQPPHVQSTGPIPQRVPISARQKKKRGTVAKKVLKQVGILLLLAIVGAGAWFATKPKTDTANQTATTEQSQTPAAADETSEQALPEGTIRLVATGTFATYDSIHVAAKSGNNYNYLPLMDDLKPVFESAEIGFCHQESLAGGADKGVTGYPDFNAPFEWSKGMIDLGCNVFNLASFNTNDKGKAAIDSAVKYFDDQDNILAVSGANRTQKEQDEIRYFEIKGVKFAALSYTTATHKPPANDYNVNIYNEAKAKKQVAEARKNAQFIIVGMNWGKEDTAAVQPEQKSIAKILALAGADLIIGNGPHILQTAEVLKGGDDREALVFYSLGNGVNSQLPLENLVGGIAVIDIDIPTQNMVNPGLLPVYQHYEWTAAQKASGNFDARKNFNLMMLDQAASALAKSQNNTTVEAQTKRVKDIMSQNVDVKILSSKDFE